MAAAEQALRTLSPIAACRRLPEPTWHGHSQVFVRLADAPEHLVVDLVVLHRSVTERFLERERHGVPVVYFDRFGEIAAVPLDRAASPPQQSCAAPSAWRRCAGSSPCFQGFVRGRGGPG